MLLISLVWLHVLGAVLWFGGSATMAAVVGPALGRSSTATQTNMAASLAVYSHRYFAISGGLTIFSGFILAWFTNRFGSPLLGIVILLAIFLAIWGARVTGPRGDAIATASDAERPAAIQRIVQSSIVEVVVFVVAFTLMILVRFGY